MRDKGDPLIGQKASVPKYYDVVNFARFLTQPGFKIMKMTAAMPAA